MRINLLEVELNNFLKYPPQDQKITFSEGIIGILGDNGAGKTSILVAITFILYGADSKGMKNRLLEPEGHVQVIFASDDNMVTFKKYKDKKGDIHRYFKLNNGVFQELGDDDYTRKVKTFIGLDYKGFKSSSITEQKEVLELGNATPKKRREILQSLFSDLAKSEKCYKETLEIISDLTINRQAAITSKDELGKRIGEIRQLKITQKPELDEQRKRILAEITSIENNLKNIDAKMVDLQTSVRAFHQLTGELRQASDDLDKTEKRAALIKPVDKTSILNTIQTKRLDRSAMGKDTDTLDKEIFALRSELETLQAKINELNVKRREFQMLSEQIQQEQDRFNQRSTSLQKKIEEGKTRVIPFQDGKQAIYRLGFSKGSMAVHERGLKRPELPASMKITYEKMIKYYQSEIEKINPLAEKFLPESSNLQALVDNLAAMNQETTKVIEGLNQKNVNLTNIIKESESKDLTKSIEQRNASIISIENKKRSIMKLDKEISDLQIKIKELEKLEQESIILLSRQDELKKRIAESRAKTEALSPAVASYAETEKLKNDTQTRLQDRRVELETINSNLKFLAVNDITKITQELKAKESTLSDIDLQIKAHQYLKVVFDKKLVNYILSSLITDLSSYSTTHVVALSAGRINAIEFFEYKDGIDINIHSESIIKDMAAISGGEAVMVNLAIRFAICQILEEMTGIKVDFLFIDEGGLMQLDQRSETNSALQRLLERLTLINKFFKTIIIITHLPISQYFTKKFVVYRDKREQSRISIPNE